MDKSIIDPMIDQTIDPMINPNNDLNIAIDPNISNDIQLTNLSTNSPDIDKTIDQEIESVMKSNKNILKEILVLSGGAAKGAAQLGAMHCLKKHNMLNNIKTIAGTSVGAMIGMLYCAGYQPMELFKFIRLLNMENIKSIKLPNFLTKYGLDDGSRMILIFVKLMGAKGFDPNISFKEFYKITKIKLIVTGACINDKKIYYFSYETYPEMKVIDAVRISMSIPIIFTPSMFDGKMFVDGGCIDNFPINLFINEIDKVIGIHVADSYPIVKDIDSLESYLVNMIRCIMEGMSHHDVKSSHRCIITIKCTNCTESATDLIVMFDEGYDSAQKKINANY
jgi:predicted acylesterase/phospholipase RssA